jgi:hypothetical protein
MEEEEEERTEEQGEATRRRIDEAYSVLEQITQNGCVAMKKKKITRKRSMSWEYITKIILFQQKNTNSCRLLVTKTAKVRLKGKREYVAVARKRYNVLVHGNCVLV